MSEPDTSVLDLHRVDEGPCPVLAVQGLAWWAEGDSEDFSALASGAEVAVGDTVVVEAGGAVELPGLILRGGNRGRAHTLVRQDSFRASPGRADAPRLVAQLEQIEAEMAPLGEDPLTMQAGPQTEVERARSADFASQNFDVEAARELSEEDARRLGAVCLFVSDETAFVAVTDLSVPKLRDLIGTLQRPVSPHVVSQDLLEALWARAYPRV